MPSISPHDPNLILVTCDMSGAYRTTDGGKTWISDFAEPLRNTTYELAFDPEIPGKIWGAFADMHDIPNGNIIHGRHYREQSGGGVEISQDFAVPGHPLP